MLILYCDFYIVKDSLSDLEKNSKISKRFDTEYKIRSSTGAYKFKEKIDVCKYMIDSYSVIAWDGVCIRYECEDKNRESEFHNYIRVKFPNAEIFNERSNSAYKYITHLELLKKNMETHGCFLPQIMIIFLFQMILIYVNILIILNILKLRTSPI